MIFVMKRSNRSKTKLIDSNRQLISVRFLASQIPAIIFAPYYSSYYPGCNRLPNIKSEIYGFMRYPYF